MGPVHDAGTGSRPVAWSGGVSSDRRGCHISTTNSTIPATAPAGASGDVGVISGVRSGWLVDYNRGAAGTSLGG